MKNILRYLCALLAALLLFAAVLLGLGRYAATGFYADHALGNDALLSRQQIQIDAQVEELAETWHFSPDTVLPWVSGAARTYREALVAWWSDLWQDPDADPALPLFLSGGAERDMVAALLSDGTFSAATPGDMQRTVARDSVAYAVDEAVCGSVLPLRRSVIDFGLSAASSAVDLSMLARLTGIVAVILAVLALLLLLLARKAAGSALTAAGGLMLLASVPVWLLNIPGMLDQLSPIAEGQGLAALLWLALPWYGLALLLLLLGSLIIRARN